jgi:hypothetical protein
VGNALKTAHICPPVRLRIQRPCYKLTGTLNLAWEEVTFKCFNRNYVVQAMTKLLVRLSPGSFGELAQKQSGKRQLLHYGYFERS